MHKAAVSAVEIAQYAAIVERCPTLYLSRTDASAPQVADIVSKLTRFLTIERRGGQRNRPVLVYGWGAANRSTRRLSKFSFVFQQLPLAALPFRSIAKRFQPLNGEPCR